MQFIKQGEFYRHFKLLIDSISGRRLLFVTRDGRFGSAALSVKPGDEVHYVSGVPVPLCLRKRGPTGGFEVVGPAMINDRGEFDRWQGKYSEIELV